MSWLSLRSDYTLSHPDRYTLASLRRDKNVLKAEDDAAHITDAQQEVYDSDAIYDSDETTLDNTSYN